MLSKDDIEVRSTSLFCLANLMSDNNSIKKKCVD